MLVDHNGEFYRRFEGNVANPAARRDVVHLVLRLLRGATARRSTARFETEFQNPRATQDGSHVHHRERNGRNANLAAICDVCHRSSRVKKAEDDALDHVIEVTFAL